MNLHSGTPFWLAKNGLAAARPPLRSPERCDVAVIGAGVTGALVADALTAAGADVIVIDRHDSGLGSTAASTALIQHEIDLELLQLCKRIRNHRSTASTYSLHRIDRPAAARASQTTPIRAARLSGVTNASIQSVCLANRR